MATLYASSADAQISSVSTDGSWSAARDATTATVSGGIRSSLAIYASHFPTRGGGEEWKVHRSFFDFDTSGVAVAPSSCTLQIYGYSSNSADIFVVKSEQDHTGVDATDFDAITGWASSGDNEGNVTKYSAEITSWSNSSYNVITLNSTALSDIASLDTFKVCLIESVHDLRDSEPSSGNGYQNGLYFIESVGTSKDPKIVFVAGVAVTDNATFFGANF